MYRQKEIGVSDLEWYIMHVIWDNDPCYFRVLIKALKDTQWSRTTISTMLKRLLEKKVIKTHRVGERLLLYIPLVTEKEAIEEHTRSFVERVYKSNAGKLVEFVAGNNEFTKKEKADIRKCLTSGTKK